MKINPDVIPNLNGTTKIDNGTITLNNLANVPVLEQVYITSNYSSYIKVWRYGKVVSVDIDGNIQEHFGIIASGLPIPVYLTYVKNLNVEDGWVYINSNGELGIEDHNINGNSPWINFHTTYIAQ